MAKSPKIEAAKEEVAEPTARKPGGKKKLIIVLASVLLMGGGGGGAWYMLKGKHSAEGEAQATPIKEVKHAKKDAPPVFLPLEPFVVNLRAQAPQSNDQFLQTDMTLRLAGPEVVDQVKQHMPEVRNCVLMLLSTKTSQELLTPEGKARLAESVRVEITAVVDPDAVKPVEQPRIKKEAAEGDKAGEAAKEAPAEETEAAAEEPQSPEDYKVKSVLFTSFVIQ
ncbi:MAG: flagellar basal body-associated FliL family protein [Betaproteobacteria bacterium]|nr:flagellar basal body-associated FliL family protein [Betaproteobacteria bacterium]